MRTPSFDVKILVEKVRIIGGYLRYVFLVQKALFQHTVRTFKNSQSVISKYCLSFLPSGVYA